MMKRLICLCLLAFPHLTTAARAQSYEDSPRRTTPASVLPPVIVSGLDGYKSKGAEEAIRLWIRDSPIEGSKDAMAQADTLRQAENLYGAYQWYEIIRTREISPRTLTIDLVLDYERGPLFTRFVVYRSNHRWVMTYFDFSFRERASSRPSTIPHLQGEAGSSRRSTLKAHRRLQGPYLPASALRLR